MSALVRIILLSATAWGALIGCASVPREAGFSDVERLVQDRLGKRIRWIQGAPEDAEVEKILREILARPLTVEDAVEVALLNNRGLQATYEELGIAQADLVQAGLLRNPGISASARFPLEAPNGTNLGFDVVASFLSLLNRPAKKAIAESEFEEVKLRVAHAVLDVAAETRSAYYTAVGSRQITEMRRMIAKATEASSEYAQRLYEAGNISELAMTLERTSHEEARREWAKAEAESAGARERLSKLLGLWGEDIKWKAPDRLPDVPAKELPLERAEAIALTRRLDLAAAKLETKTLLMALELAGRWRGIGEVDIGASAERETDGQWVVGPALSLGAPLFDQGQAEIARAGALLRAHENRMMALAVEIRSDVRALRDRLMMNRYRIEHSLKVIIPLREKAVALTQEQWNFMLVGAFELIESKKREFDAYQEYIEAVQDYWISRSDLIRALGGEVPDER